VIAVFAGGRKASPADDAGEYCTLRASPAMRTSPGLEHVVSAVKRAALPPAVATDATHALLP
jgi:hypothetical protein